MIVVIDFVEKPPIVDLDYNEGIEEIRRKYKDKINRVTVVKNSAQAYQIQKLWRDKYDERIRSAKSATD